MQSKILGLDNDRLVNKVILGILVIMDSIEERQVPQFLVAAFLAEAIHTQLVNLGTLKHFRYQTYLMHIFFHYNQEDFLEMQRCEPLAIGVEISPVNEDGNEGMFRFINKIMPKASKQLKKKLQLSLETRIGDWYLFENRIVIKLYGFEDEPFLLPSFFTPKIYSLE